MTHRFGSRLQQQFDTGRRLCVGIDPHAFLLADWGLSETANDAERFGLAVVEASVGHAAAVKPQVAFFERFGAAGYAALERVIASARQAGLLVIADAKRGDVGSSFDAYADAWLAPGSSLESDALTVSAFQGFGVLDGALKHVHQSGKGLFVLAATSNPEAKIIQSAKTQTGASIAQHLLQEIDTFNSLASTEGQIGDVGAVLGGTLDLHDFEIDVSPVHLNERPAAPILAPGIGHQGGDVESMRTSFGRYFASTLVNESRSLLMGGASGLDARVRFRADELRVQFGAA